MVEERPVTSGRLNLGGREFKWCHLYKVRIDFIYLFSKFIRHAIGLQSVFFKNHYIVSRKRLKGLSLVLAGS